MKFLKKVFEAIERSASPRSELARVGCGPHLALLDDGERKGLTEDRSPFFCCISEDHDVRRGEDWKSRWRVEEEGAGRTGMLSVGGKDVLSRSLVSMYDRALAPPARPRAH